MIDEQNEHLPSTADVEPSVGESIKHFRVLQRCGHGAYAVGFLCEDTRLPGRRVLVKWAKRAAPEIRAKFRAQANYELKLTSEHVRRTHEYDEVEGRPIIVHEFIEGVRLDEWAAGKALGLRLERFAHLVRALADLEQSGTPHGELHLGNAIVSGDRTVLFDLDPTAFGSTVTLRSRKQRLEDDRQALIVLINEMFDGEHDAGLRSQLEPLARAGAFDELLIQVLERRGQEARRPRSDHGDVRRAVRQRISTTLESYESYVALRHAAIQGVMITFSAAIDAILPETVRTAGTVVSTALSTVIDRDAQEAKGKSWRLGGYQESVHMHDGRSIHVEVDAISSGFVPPWPEKLMSAGLLATGLVLPGTVYGGNLKRAVRLELPMPTTPHGPAEWQVLLADGSRQRLDVDRMVEVLKLQLLDPSASV